MPHFVTPPVWYTVSVKEYNRFHKHKWRAYILQKSNLPKCISPKSISADTSLVPQARTAKFSPIPGTVDFADFDTGGLTFFRLSRGNFFSGAVPQAWEEGFHRCREPLILLALIQGGWIFRLTVRGTFFRSSSAGTRGGFSTMPGIVDFAGFDSGGCTFSALY